VVPQAYPQGSYAIRRLGGGTITQISDLGDLRWLLRLGGERRGQDPGSQRAKERPALHHSIT
jgi:hypothetical protein